MCIRDRSFSCALVHFSTSRTFHAPYEMFSAQCRELTADLSKATRGEAFVLMGGDCAESFSEFKVCASMCACTFRFRLSQRLRCQEYLLFFVFAVQPLGPFPCFLLCISLPSLAKSLSGGRRPRHVPIDPSDVPRHDVRRIRARGQGEEAKKRTRVGAVSYTHLTLPTILLV